ncbi:MAG: 7TM-DISM domain-containing protein [Phaeospirillum sp.]|nr:7TM-DISM domain-containing protein [Phaeospirillum sp.]
MAIPPCILGRLAVLLMLAIAAAAPIPAVADTIRLDGATTRIDLAGRMDLLRDEAGALTIGDMARPEIAARFQALPGNLTAGYDRAVFWLRFQVQREPSAGERWFLDVKMPYLDHVSLYSPDGAGGFAVVKTGDMTPFSTRPVAHRSFVFSPRFPAGGLQTAYIRIQSASTMTVNAQIWADVAFTENVASESLLLGLVNGSLICMILFSLFQYALKRDVIYIHYIAYISTSEIMYLAAAGYLTQYIFPNSPGISNTITGLSVGVSFGFGLIFTARVLCLPNNYPRINRIYVSAGFLMILSSTGAIFDHFYLVAPVIHTITLLSLLPSTYMAAALSWRGDRVARFFLAAILVYMTTLGLILLRTIGLYDTPMAVNALTQAAAVPHMLLLSLGLLHRTAGIDATRLETARRTERYLERRVALRTAELAETNTTLAAEITVRRVAEDRLRESERQVRAILDAAPFPMVAAGFPGGEFLFLNQPAADLLNVDRDRTEAFNTRDFYADINERDLLLATLQATGCVLGAELRILRMPAEQCWVLLSAVRFNYRDQDAVLICLNDISTRKRLEETLRLANLRSEAALESSHQAMREQRNFLSMVSHEFRVPLAIIQAASQLLGIYTASNEEAVDEVAKIGRAVRRMSDLIDVCLADDRLDSNIPSLNVAQVDLGELLTELCDDKHPFAANHPLSVTCDRPTMIEADLTLLRISFSNLIDNALKFSPPGSPVEVAIANDGEGAMVRVTDHGPGISLDDQPRIFEKFFRSTKADRVRGAGLGLYIVRRIIDLHNGCVAVDSRPGMGASFVVWLPLTALSPGNDRTTP